MIKEFRGEFGFLSNFWPCSVTVWGFKFPSAEHAYQAAKAKEPSVREQFLQGTPGQAKRLGRKIQVRSDWEQIKLEAMKEVVKAKFLQNPSLKRNLLATGTQELVEGNRWHDGFWGTCLCGKCPQGQNQLGQILMEVRSALRVKVPMWIRTEVIE